MLSDALGEEADVVLIDQAEGFVFGFSKLDVMFGRTSAGHVLHRYADIDKPGLRFVQARIESLDPTARRVVSEGGHEFYTVAGALSLRDVLASFDAGRVVIGDLNTVQVPARSQRDSLDDARLPDRPRAGGPLGARPGHSSAPRPSWSRTRLPSAPTGSAAGSGRAGSPTTSPRDRRTPIG